MRFYDSTTCLDILHRFNKIKPWKFSKCGEISEKVSMVWSSFVFFSLHLAFYGDIYIYIGSYLLNLKSVSKTTLKMDHKIWISIVLRCPTLKKLILNFHQS